MATMNRTLASLSMLKGIMDTQPGHYLDYFIPLLATLAFEKQYKDAIKPETLVSEFSEFTGIRIPLQAMYAILGRSKNVKLTHKSDQAHFFDQAVAHKLAVTNELKEFDNKQIDLFKKFQKFALDEFKVTLNDQDASNSFLTFLSKNDIEFLAQNNGGTLFTQKITERKSEIFLVAKFINHCSEHDRQTFQYFLDFTLGHIISYALFLSEDVSFEGSLEQCEIYLDTPFLFKLLGIEGPEKSKHEEFFIELLKKNNATLYIFQHVREEISQILDDCVYFIDHPGFKEQYASAALKYFVAEKFNKSDLEIFISQIDKKLAAYGISIKPPLDPNLLQAYQINEESLSSLISKWYGRDNPTYINWKKKKVLERDVQSISYIYKLRRDRIPSNLKDSYAIFVTTNSALAAASREFDRIKNGIHKTIFPCVTDVFLGTALWLRSPTELLAQNMMNYISIASAVIRPNEKLLIKFLNTLDNLKQQQLITSEEYYYLRSSRPSIELLEDATLNDPDQFRETLPHEILAKIKNQATLEKQQEIDSLTQENRRQVQKRKGLFFKARRNSRYLAIGLTYLVIVGAATLISVIGFYAMFQNLFAAYLWTVLSVVGLITGTGLFKLNKPLVKMFYRLTRRLFM